MKYKWIDYSGKYKETVESWLDDTAKRFTGCSDGFDDYYQYWINDKETKLGENFWVKIILLENKPIGAVALGLSDGAYVISEFLICPDMRGKGFGSSILNELIIRSRNIIGIEIKNATAVIFPDNIASQKAFTKAGFVLQSVHPDGDAYNYSYHKYT